MKYQEAIEWIEANKHLVGTKTEDNFSIGDLVVVPAKPEDQNSFLKAFVFNRNKESSLIPFIYGELEVWAIDTYHLETCGLLIYKQMA